MSFHERMAWLVLVTTLLSTALYVWLVEGLSPETGFWDTMPTLGTVILVTVALVAVTVAGIIILTITRGGRQTERPDEREQLIETRGSAYGYWMLNAALIPAFWMLMTDQPKAHIFHALAFATFAASLVEYGSQILRHRLNA